MHTSPVAAPPLSRRSTSLSFLRTPLLVLFALLAAVAARAQTQVGTLPATQPTYLAIDTDASGTRWLYVSQHGEVRTDGTVPTNGGVVLKYNLSTGSTTPVKLTTHGTGDGQFISPDGIVVDPATHDIFVADRYLSRIQRLHNDGTFVMKWGSTTSGAPDEMHGPCGLAMDASGAIYVAEHGDTVTPPFGNGGQHVSKYTISGTTATRLWRIGSYGGGNGQFNKTGPYGVAISGSSIFVADAFSRRVETFDLDGNYKSQFGLGSTAEPLGLTLDASGSLWIAETSNYDGSGALQQVQKYNTAGGYAGTTLTGTPAFSLPFDAAIDAVTNRAYVSDYAHSRVVVFDLSSSPPPSTGVPVVTDASVSGTVGTAIGSVQVKATNSPTSFSAPALAAYGLKISSTGVITGTPIATATNAKVSVTATNNSGTSTAATITLNLSPSTALVPTPVGPVVTSFAYVAHTYTFKIAFSEPVTGVDVSDFVFTQYGLSTGKLNGVTQNDASHYTLTFTFYSGAPGAFAIDLKTSGTGIVGVNSGLPYVGAGVTKAVVPVTPHTQTDAPVVGAFTVDHPIGNTVNFRVTFNKGTWNIQPTNVTINTTGSAQGTLGAIVPADNSSTVYLIPVTFSGTGTISLTLTNATQKTISDGNYNLYVGPNTSAVFTVPATVAPVVSNAVVTGKPNTAITPVQVYASGSPTAFTAAGLADYGLSIDASGNITGTPTRTANYIVVPVTATGSRDSAPGSIILSISSGATASVPVVSNATVSGTVGSPITPVKVTATNSPTGFSASGLAAYGLGIDASGTISGTPTAAASGVIVQVTASNSAGTSAPANITLNLAAAPTATIPVVSDATVNGSVGTPIAAVQVNATNSPTSFSASGLAAYGLAIDATGQITGTPTSAASGTTVQVTASNSAGTSAPANITLNIAASPTAQVPVVSNLTVNGTVGTPISGVQVSATNAPTSFSAPSLADYGLAIDASGNVTGTPTTTASGVTVQVTASNAAGTSAPATLTLNIGSATPPPPPPPPPGGGGGGGTLKQQTLVFTPPVSDIFVGQPIQLGATTDSGLPITYTVISGDATVNGDVLLITSPGAVVVRATQSGNATYAAASVDATFNPRRAAQSINLTSMPASTHTDSALTLPASTDSGLPITYTVVSGPATIDGNSLVFTGSGQVTVSATQDGNNTYEPTSSTFTVTGTAIPRLVNLSSRVHVTQNDAGGAAIAGFVVTGNAPKQILVRAVGPSLSAHGVSDPLAAPSLTVFDVNGNPVATNSGWNDDTAIANAAQAVSAFPLTARGKDAALLMTLQPGTYTAQVQSATGSGTALIEVYDVSAAAAAPTKQLVNMSARGAVGTGENVLVGGFAVNGEEPKTVLIRAVGPTLTKYGVTAALNDPVLRVYRGQDVIAQNDNWGTPIAASNDTPATAAQIETAANATGAFPLPSGSADAVILVTLPPGTYSAVVSGANGSTGEALVEVYDVPASAAP